MCELFGISSAKNIRANELLDAFYNHSYMHQDGWGLALFHGNEVSVEKEPVRAVDSRYLAARLSRPILCTNLLAHIRRATIGRIEYVNCHPFVLEDASGRTWTQIHNGTMFDSEVLAPYISLQEGTTDSERVLWYIIDRVNKELEKENMSLSGEHRIALIDRLLGSLSRGNKLNMLLFDGENLYVHTNCRDSLYVHSEPGTRVIATSPVCCEDWEALPMNRLLVYKNGALIYTGESHGNEFREEDHDLATLYSAFAEL